MSHLVLVESPGKVHKIQSFLGDDYEVIATIGHIRQLPKDTLGFEIENNYEPTFEIMPDKQDVVKKIIAKARGVDKVLLAGDGDNEGSAIAWHCAEVLKLPANKRYRVTFNEITKKAITNAINDTLKTNRQIDMKIVYAQFARMVLDKLIGYKVSPLLWKEYNNWHLSCGRVQSVVVKIIAEREQEISQFTSQAVFKIDGQFVLDKKELGKAKAKFILTTCENEIKDKTRVEEIYNDTKTMQVKWIIKSITKNNSKRNPQYPFTTSTLQQEASARLGMSPDVCMKIAQKLYEAGFITYMRTDANFIAEDAMKAIKICVENKWNEAHYRRMDYKTKSTSAQEGHECCRPVDFAKESALGGEGITSQHNSLYQLIWRRTVASQMAPAEVETRTVKIVGDNTSKEKDIVFVGKHEKILFEGYMACFNMHKKKISNTINKNEEKGNDIIIPSDKLDIDEVDEIDELEHDLQDSQYLEKIFAKLKEGGQVYVNGFNGLQRFTKPPHARYTEASLVKKLDDLGIGRPSTYASMIKKVQEDQRQYVEKKSLEPKKVKVASLRFDYPDKIQIVETDMKIEGDKNKLFPTSLGIMINDYLQKNFIDIMDYEFTAQIETLLDEIALGSKIWYKVVDSVYIKLNPIIDQLSRATANRKLLQSNTPDADNANRRLLGINPSTQLPIHVIKSRKGLLICESNPEKEKSRFANITSSFDTVTLEQALKLLVFPRVLGQFRDKDIVIKKAMNVYIAYDNINYSIENYCKANPDIYIEAENITLEQAQEVILYYEASNKAKVENAKLDRVMNEDIVIKKGPFGAYIKYKGEKNIPLPKTLKELWETVTLEQCLTVIEKNANRKPRTAPGGRKGIAKGNVKPKTKPDDTIASASVSKVKVKPKVKSAAPRKAKN